ncbi:drug resistance transporter, Bcr/CflA subfamily [Intrasporangium calvum DSM 43043]|uniref:Drug resistance transporter, Bcr/CflA subfamily n=1 Tax=Intrasporangium calvum (strain ATCC 23552 / DSM 43043 / JCM 3097 / NBRC 12989 / NCIMB 10167 / NRRL B-3866 / 7 KIP) TaxID=710696 RepID=E6SAM5_INTC7|nr:drug resistance transporter, Bcr/CflA subfamily [Intrasporangium calvum DSM 43043]
MTGPSGRLTRVSLILVLAALTMVGPFSIDAILPAFDALSTELRVDDASVQQTLSVYLGSFAFASLFHGSLSDAVGRKPVILTGCALYALASAWCALAPSMPVLLAGRAAQGLVAGAGMIVGRTVVRDLYDGPSAQRFMSHISMIFAIAPALAPIVGGWILGWGSWRTIFWVLAGYGFVIVLLTGVLLPETHPRSSRIPFRPKPLVTSFLAAARDPSVLRLSSAIALNFSALFLYIASAPAIVVDHLGLGAQDFGVLFVPLVVAMMLGSFLTGRLVGRVRQGAFVAAGFAIALAGSAFAVVYQATAQPPQTAWSVVPAATGALGVALIFPILTISLLDLRPRERGAVSSFQAFLSTLLNAVVAGVAAPLVSGSLVTLALVSGAFTSGALLLWLIHRRSHRAPSTRPDLPLEEPTDQL